jgi:hypothetical protein
VVAVIRRVLLQSFCTTPYAKQAANNQNIEQPITNRLCCVNKHLNSVNKNVAHPFPIHVCTAFRLSSKHVCITRKYRSLDCLYKQQVLINSSVIHVFLYCVHIQFNRKKWFFFPRIHAGAGERSQQTIPYNTHYLFKLIIKLHSRQMLPNINIIGNRWKQKSDDKFNHSSLNICNTFEQFPQINGIYQ